MRSFPLFRGAAAVGVLLAAGATFSAAQPTMPVYTTTVVDATTGDNEFTFGSFRYWTVDAGSDSYQNDLYERPTSQGFQFVNGRYAVNEYFSYIDIERASFGFDDRFVYASIDVLGREKRTQDGAIAIEGLIGHYGVRFGADPDGRNSIYIKVEQPEVAAGVNTVWTLLKTSAFRDTDRDVGGRGGPIHGQPGPSGLNVTKTDNPLEEYGLNGYDAILVQSDGLTADGQLPVLWQRISPTDNTVVEIAFDYLTAGLTRASIEATTYLHFEAQDGSLSDPQHGLWNDQYTGIEAGSPNPGIGTDNEFGTQGTGSISGVDNVRAGSITPPPPPSSGACCIGSACSIATPANCAAAGGTSAGVGTTCTASRCCVADFNRDGTITVGDVFEFLVAFFANDPAADANGDGAVTVQDVFTFLTAFFAGC